MIKRCLIIGCSETKIEKPDPLPAIERYDGPPFRVLRRYLNDTSSANEDRLDVFILSAEYGLIEGSQKIPVYDRRMTRQRAEAIKAKVLCTFQQQIASQNYDDLFISAGRTYLLVLDGSKALLPATTKVTISSGGSGRKLTELKTWLNGQERPIPGQLSPPLDDPNNNGCFAHPTTGVTRLKRVELKATPEEIYETARQALATNSGNPNNFKDWYVLIGEEKVSPKWLVSQLTRVPVNSFDAGAARRVLNRLGVPVYKNE